METLKSENMDCFDSSVRTETCLHVRQSLGGGSAMELLIGDMILVGIFHC